MADPPAYPTYFFRVDELAERTLYPRSHPRTGEWVPPRTYGANVILPEQILRRGTVFYFDGDTTNPQPVLLPEHLRTAPHHAYSIYCGEANRLWTVPYDATCVQVFNGIDDGTNTPALQGAYPDWRELNFASLNRNHQSVSHATYPFDENNRHHRLLLWRTGQDWVRQIIPARYRPDPQPQRTRRDAPTGGLTGDIALLIGLIALSIPPAPPPQHPQRNMLYYLPRCVQRNFQAISLQAGLRGSDARRVGRGVLVRVWIYLPPPLSPQEQMSAEFRDAHNRMTTLARFAFSAFERGRHGPLFR